MPKNLKDVRSYSVILVDSMNLLSRQFHGMSSLSYNGVPTGMLYGTMRFVMQMRYSHPRAKLIFLWEGGDSARKKVFPLYKANRMGRLMDKTEFHRSLEMTAGALNFMGIEQMRHEGLEADDLADYMTRNGEGPFLLVSHDWDWWQFSSPKTDILYKGKIMTAEDLELQLRFPPERFYIYKALCGDSSDGIPGVYRFPTKVAEALARTCKSGDDLIPEMMKIGQSRLAEKIKGQLEVVERNLEVLNFGRRNFDAGKLVVEWQPMDKDSLRRVFEKHGMREFLEQLAL
jgi:DNA polymerase I